MGKSSNWSDDYWLLLLQLYLRKPVGVKPVYNRAMVGLAMELHIHPQVLFGKLCQIATLQTPRIERIWERYSDNPRRLNRAVRLLREMKGYGHADEFYEGVEVNESFEKDFKPVADDSSFCYAQRQMTLPRMYQKNIQDYHNSGPNRNLHPKPSSERHVVPNRDDSVSLSTTAYRC